MQAHLEKPWASYRMLDLPQTPSWRAQEGRPVIEKLDVTIRRIEAGVVENIECVEVIANSETLGNVKFLTNSVDESPLKRPTENIPASISKTGFVHIADAAGVTRRNAVFPWREQWDCERIDVQHWFSRVDAR